MYHDVILVGYVQGVERLKYDVLKDGRGEIHVERAFVDDYVAVTFREINASDSGLTTADSIDSVHLLLLDCVNVYGFGVLSFKRMVGTIEGVEVFELLRAETGLGEHAFHHLDVKGVLARLNSLFE